MATPGVYLMTFHDLPEPLPALLGELSAEDRKRLLQLWQASRTRQHAELAQAMERIVQGLPALFRGPGRKILR